jgi:hypothetical protein
MTRGNILVLYRSLFGSMFTYYFLILVVSIVPQNSIYGNISEPLVCWGCRDEDFFKTILHLLVLLGFYT